MEDLRKKREHELASYNNQYRENQQLKQILCYLQSTGN